MDEARGVRFALNATVPFHGPANSSRRSVTPVVTIENIGGLVVAVMTAVYLLAAICSGEWS